MRERATAVLNVKTLKDHCVPLAGLRSQRSCRMRTPKSAGRSTGGANLMTVTRRGLLTYSHGKPDRRLSEEKARPGQSA
jgi:hypothetical protein